MGLCRVGLETAATPGPGGRRRRLSVPQLRPPRRHRRRKRGGKPSRVPRPASSGRLQTPTAGFAGMSNHKAPTQSKLSKVAQASFPVAARTTRAGFRQRRGHIAGVAQSCASVRATTRRNASPMTRSRMPPVHVVSSPNHIAGTIVCGTTEARFRKQELQSPSCGGWADGNLGFRRAPGRSRSACRLAWAACRC